MIRAFLKGKPMPSGALVAWALLSAMGSTCFVFAEEAGWEQRLVGQASGVGGQFDITAQQDKDAGDADASALPNVSLAEDAEDAGLPAYKIVTPTAVYYLEKTGAGLSSMIDADGNDWIGFDPAPGSRAAGEFRGFPNAVHFGGGVPGYFHARNAGTGLSRTEIVSRSPDQVSIAAESEDGKWACRYDFTPTHCTFTMTRIPEGGKYWVLYEGTPGGAFDDEDWWLTSAGGAPQPMTQTHDDDIPAPEWIAFGDKEGPRSILFVHHQDDAHPDTFRPMEQSMTVFGFARKNTNKYFDEPNHAVSVGFVESQDSEAIRKAAARMISQEAR